VNDTKDELQRMREAVDRINPDRIDLNTVVRPPSETWVRPLIQKELEEIQTFFGEKARIILEFDRHPVSISGEEIRGRVLDILSRRPLSLVDLSKWLRIPPAELEVHLGPLVKEGKVKVRPFRDTTYYEASFD
jgi:wyosine [tRNA(Phe)-imidazoG37] synthetase (radical SAM superfamily)